MGIISSKYCRKGGLAPSLRARVLVPRQPMFPSAAAITPKEEHRFLGFLRLVPTRLLCLAKDSILSLRIIRPTLVPALQLINQPVVDGVPRNLLGERTMASPNRAARSSRSRGRSPGGASSRGAISPRARGPSPKCRIRLETPPQPPNAFGLRTRTRTSDFCLTYFISPRRPPYGNTCLHEFASCTFQINHGGHRCHGNGIYGAMVCAQSCSRCSMHRHILF